MKMLSTAYNKQYNPRIVKKKSKKITTKFKKHNILEPQSIKTISTMHLRHYYIITASYNNGRLARFNK